MVVNPKSLKERIQENQAQKIARLETHIDSALETEFDGERAIINDGEKFEGVHSLARDSLLDRYRAAGWTVEHHSDQREGSWYEFSPARGRVQRGGDYGDTFQ